MVEVTSDEQLVALLGSPGFLINIDYPTRTVTIHSMSCKYCDPRSKIGVKPSSKRLNKTGEFWYSQNRNEVNSKANEIAETRGYKRHLCTACYKEVWEQAPTRKFTIPIWIPVILLIATIIQLFRSGKSLLETIDISLRMLQSYEGPSSGIADIQAMWINNIINSALYFVGAILLYVFLWGVLYYLYKTTGNKLFSKSSVTTNT